MVEIVVEEDCEELAFFLTTRPEMKYDIIHLSFDVLPNFGCQPNQKRYLCWISIHTQGCSDLPEALKLKM